MSSSSSSSSSESKDTWFDSILYTRENSFYQTTEKWFLKWNNPNLELWYHNPTLNGIVQILSDSHVNFESMEEFHHKAPDLICSFADHLQKRGVLDNYYKLRENQKSETIWIKCGENSNFSGSFSIGDFGLNKYELFHGDDGTLAQKRVVWNIDPVGRQFVVNSLEPTIGNGITITG
jgi:hypothetical protein